MVAFSIIPNFGANFKAKDFLLLNESECLFTDHISSQ